MLIYIFRIIFIFWIVVFFASLVDGWHGSICITPKQIAEFDDINLFAGICIWLFFIVTFIDWLAHWKPKRKENFQND